MNKILGVSDIYRINRNKLLRVKIKTDADKRSRAYSVGMRVKGTDLWVYLIDYSNNLVGVRDFNTGKETILSGGGKV